MKAAVVLARLFLCLAFVAGGGASAFAQSEEFKAKIAKLKQKAEQGDTLSQDDLGDRYLSGNGVLPNYKEAARLFRLLAEGNSILKTSSQHKLGLMYFNGKGVAQNYSEAYIWFALAAHTLYLYGGGDEYAKEVRDDIVKLMQMAEKNLTTEEVNQAQAEAKKRLQEIEKKRTAAAQ